MFGPGHTDVFEKYEEKAERPYEVCARLEMTRGNRVKPRSVAVRAIDGLPLLDVNGRLNCNVTFDGGRRDPKTLLGPVKPAWLAARVVFRERVRRSTWHTVLQKASGSCSKRYLNIVRSFFTLAVTCALATGTVIRFG